MNKITASNLPNLGVEPKLRYHGKNLTEATYKNVNSSIHELSLFFSEYTGLMKSTTLNGRFIDNSYLELSEDGKLHLVIVLPV